jgi:hypothetical protein
VSIPLSEESVASSLASVYEVFSAHRRGHRIEKARLRGRCWHPVSCLVAPKFELATTERAKVEAPAHVRPKGICYEVAGGTIAGGRGSLRPSANRTSGQDRPGRMDGLRYLRPAGRLCLTLVFQCCVVLFRPRRAGSRQAGPTAGPGTQFVRRIQRERGLARRQGTLANSEYAIHLH